SSLIRNLQSATRNCDEPYKHHRAADFRRYSGIFSQLRPKHHAEVQGWRLSAARAIFDQRLGAEKTDHIRAYWIEVARPTRTRECCTSGRKQRAARDQPGPARCGA